MAESIGAHVQSSADPDDPRERFWIATVHEALERGSPEEALHAAQRVASVEPNNPTVWFWIGIIQEQMGRVDEAVAAMCKASELEPQESEVYFYTGKILNNAGRFEEALTPLSKAIELDDTPASAWLQIGHSYLNLQRFNDAVAAYTKATQLEPSQAEAWYGLAAASQRNGDAECALTALEKALELHPNFNTDVPVLMLKTSTLISLGRYSEAVDTVQIALPLSRSDERGLLWLQEGIARNELGEFQAAIKAFDTAIPGISTPSLSVAWLQKGIALNALGSNQEALDALRKANELVPETPVPPAFWLQMGTALHGTAQFDQALAALEKAAAPGGAPIIISAAWAQKALVLAKLHRFDEARSAAREASSCAPASTQKASWLFLEAAVLARQGNAEAALETLTEATQLDSSALPIWVSRAQTAAAIRRGEEALRCFNKVLELTANHTALTNARLEALISMADVLIGQERPNDALQALDEARALQVSSVNMPRFWSLRFAVMSALGRGHEGLVEFQALSAANPVMAKHPVLQFVRAGAASVLGQTKEALDAFSVLADDPAAEFENDAVAWLVVAAARSHRNAETALAALEKARGLDEAVKRNPLYWFSSCSGLHKLGRYKEAVAAADNLIAASGETWEVFKGLALEGLKDPDAALQAYDKAVEASQANPHAEPFATIALTRKGHLLLSMARKAEALETFERAVQCSNILADADPNKFLALLGKALALYSTGRLDEANDVAAQAATLSERLPATFPNRAVAWCAMGLILSELNREEEALQAFSRAEGTHSSMAAVAISKAEVLLKLQDYEKADDVFTEALAQASNDQERFEALLGKGRSLKRLEEFDKAIDCYRQAIAFSNTPETEAWLLWQYLGETYSIIGRHQAALGAFRSGWRLYKDARKPIGLALGISSALIELKREQEAIDFLVDARDKTKSDPRLDFNRGVALYRADKLDLAKEAWTAAAKEGLADARNSLTQLNLTSPSGKSWTDYWFELKPGISRRVLGSILLGLLLIGVSVGVIRPNAQDWRGLIAPLVVVIVLLLLPTFASKSTSLGSVKLETLPSRPESPMSRSHMAELLRTLQVIAPTASTLPGVGAGMGLSVVAAETPVFPVLQPSGSILPGIGTTAGFSVVAEQTTAVDILRSKFKAASRS